MRFSIAAASTALLALAEARITGIKVPKEIKRGEEFEAIITREGYIQSVLDSSIVFGYAAGDSYPGTVGTPFASIPLGFAKSNKAEDLTVKLTIPDKNTPIKDGEGIVAASLFSIYGASGSPTITNYNVTVTLGDKTSSEYVEGTQ
ncbi:hypothetical protein NW768_009281 [Fusarium equiseti]|uniref:Secreted protein nis1 n=1 Tax=Fusarium equiseti TaxID=61235 RepID=A0ABQ8R3B4_FUSEQ|nr:hypothetical protein NW768_009281 [Fusarium equiseti]